MPYRRLREFFDLCLNWRLRRLITPYIDAELDAVSRARVQAHLEGCAHCREEYARLLFASRIASHLLLPDEPPAGMPAWSLAKQPAGDLPRQRSPRHAAFKVLPLAAALLVIVAGALVWYGARTSTPSDESWEVIRLSGAPVIGSDRMGKTARLNVGEWIETDDKSRAMLGLGLMGQVEIDPNTRIGLVKARSSELRLTMTRGRVSAMITARPGIFFVETPSGMAADLGCAYTLEVDDSGQTFVYVTAGAVALTHDGRESMVPAGAACRARPGTGPGTPYLMGASKPLQDALAELDFEGGGAKALRTVLTEANASDAITLWNLLKRVEGADRGRVYDRLAQFVPPPEGATRDALLRLDSLMLDRWLQALEQKRVNPFSDLPLAPGSIRMTGNMEVDRAWHRATLLPDGRVLVTGGLDSYGNALARAELYDPATGQFTRAGDMNAARAVHTATLLPNGKVLIAAGLYSNKNEESLATAELYDPETNSFTPTGDLNNARGGQEATLLPDGRVLITGGVGPDRDVPMLPSAEIYDPATETFTPTGSLNEPRVDHTATLLGDGRVLIAGGFGSRGSDTGVTSGAELYDPAKGAFASAGEMIFHRAKHSAVLLADGKVLISGGIAYKETAGRKRPTTAELYDPSTGAFVRTGDMILDRFKVGSAAALLKNGKVLIAGGSWGFEVYDPSSGSFSMKTGSLNLTRYYSTATLLPNGEVVIIGGYSGITPGDFFHASAGAWIYQPE